MHHTGKKESKKEILKKEKKKGYENFASKVFEPGPSEPLDHLGNAYKVSLKGICTPSLWWLAVFKDAFFVFFF